MNSDNNKYEMLHDIKAIYVKLFFKASLQIEVFCVPSQYLSIANSILGSKIVTV